MTLIKSLNETILYPFAHAIPKGGKAKLKEAFGFDSCADSVKSRLLLVAQVITSIIALPLILLLGLVSAPFAAMDGKGSQVLKEMWESFKLHAIVMIPGSLAGVFTPIKTTVENFNSLKDCYNSCAPRDNCIAEHLSELIKAY